MGALTRIFRRQESEAAMQADHPIVASMAPLTAASVAAADPEANMPRWRRPSLKAARFSDPKRLDAFNRTPMCFSPDTAPTTAELRVVRYAMVPLLDRPDEVLGMQMADLMAGDELQVVESSGAYWEVVTPDGERGWVHRTTLGMPSPMAREESTEPEARINAEDALSALLAARGLN
jgi:hypothetical protein